jgi:hypothetical protein
LGLGQVRRRAKAVRVGRFATGCGWTLEFRWGGSVLSRPGEGPLPAAPTSEALRIRHRFVRRKRPNQLMTRCRSLAVLLTILSIALLGVPEAGAQATASAATPQPSASSSTSTRKPVTSATARRRARRRTTHTKFVPKQKVPTPDRITEIQSALAHNGYYQGDPNGKWDTTSIAAMQKFQSAHGIEPTGKLDAPSLQKLGLGSDIAGVSAPKPPLPSGTQPGAGSTTAPPRGASAPSGAASTSASNEAPAGTSGAKAAQ